jgi:hypothetical protein
MKVALFLKDERINGADIEVLPIIILHLGEKTVVEVEKDIIVKKDVNYLALWLLNKKIKEIYVADIDPLVKKLFEKLNVVVRKHEEMEKNPLLKPFIS